MQEAKEAFRIKKHERRENALPTAGRKPAFTDYYCETYFGKAKAQRKRPGTLENWKSHFCRRLPLAFAGIWATICGFMFRPAFSPRLLALALLCAVAPSLHAQINVSLEIPRHLYLCYEPIIATVTITNMTGRELTLSDKAPDKWFSFEILNAQGTPIPPTASDYHLEPLTIPMGQTVKRKVNLVNLYPVTDYGVYHVRALVYFADMDKYFGSPVAGIEVSEGQTLWQQTVGIPDGQKNAGQYRSYTLLSFRQPRDNMLYVRIEDENAGLVYGTFPLGRLINGYEPEEQVDELSQLHILQMVAPKEYLYTRLGPNAEMLGQEDYTDLKTRPRLARTSDGQVAISGGIEVLPSTAQTTVTGPKLSDRPAGMPPAQ